jgi:hypothetical protein
MKIAQLHQVELTSRCNLRCQYCVHSKMKRAKQDMPREVFERVLEIVAGFYKAGTQHELNLCGIGESTMHGEFEELVGMAREALPYIDLTMATNGVGMTDDIARSLQANLVRVWVSLHRPELAGPAIELLKKHGVLAGISADPSIAAVDWAGQVDWHVSAPPVRCMWLERGSAIVWSDGRVGTCCLDGQGEDGVIGTVWDDPDTWHSKPYSLCKTCHMEKN